MSVYKFIQIVLVVFNGFFLLKTAEAGPLSLDVATRTKQYLKNSVQDISKEASNLSMKRKPPIQFLLFTPNYTDSPCYLEPNKEALERCPFDPTYPMKIVVHGFIAMLSPGNPFFKIKDKILESYKYNVIVLDWTKYYQPNYVVAAVNTGDVGYELATLIRFIKNTKGVDPQNVHLIGHGLGAHISGVAGEQIPNLGRITGLDPAVRIFYPNSYLQRLRESAADFVDIIHSSNRTSGNGIEDPIGDIDFYPNGGQNQPKCELNEEEFENQENATGLSKPQACNHNAAIFYFLHSINTNECIFLASKCSSYEDFQKGLCSNDSFPKARMGLPAVPIPGLASKSKFFLKTSPPYCPQNDSDKQKSVV